MEVKIIIADGVLDLERDVNKFLNGINDSQIIDIKYQSVGNHTPYGAAKPSAMIIMK